MAKYNAIPANSSTHEALRRLQQDVRYTQSVQELVNTIQHSKTRAVW